jgi:uncharacterized protein
VIRDEIPLSTLLVLPWKKQLSFALLIFERMLPSLITFSKDTARDASCYFKGRDIAWDILRNGGNGTAARSLNEECLKNAPDTEDFTHELTSCALNAALTMSDILEFTEDRLGDHITYISTLATDSLHLYLHGLDPVVLSNPDRDERLAAHPLMQQELRRQEEDIKFLSTLPDHFDNEIISTLRARTALQPPMLPV